MNVLDKEGDLLFNAVRISIYPPPDLVPRTSNSKLRQETSRVF